MSAKIGSLQLDIGANVARMQKDMGKIEKTVSKSAKGMVKTANVIKTAFGAMLTGVVLKRVVDFGAALVDDADKMEELALTTGVTVENLSRLGFVASQSKTDLTTLANGLRILGKNADDTSMGIGMAREAFTRLNIEVKDSNGELKNIDDLFMEIASNIGNLSNTTEQAAVAQKLFGKSGAQLVPILKKGVSGIQELKDKADELGITISTEFAKDAGILNDEIDTMKKSFEGLAREALPEIIKSVTEGAKATTEFILAIKEFGNSETSKGLSNLYTWLKDVDDAIVAHLPHIILAKKLYKEMTQEVVDGLAVGDDAGTSDLMARFLGDKDEAEKAGKEFSKSLTDGLMAGFEEANLDEVVAGLVDEESLLAFENQMLVLQRAVEPLEDFVDISEEVAIRSSEAFSLVSGAVGNMTGQISAFADGASISFTDFVDSIIKDVLRMQAVKFLTNMLTPLFGAETKNVTFDQQTSMPRFHELATGGVAMASTFANIGEGADPEAVLPLARIGGKLGVRSAGGGDAKMIVNITNNSKAQLQTSSRTENGMEIFEAMIIDTVIQGNNEGTFDQSLGSNFQIERGGISR